MNLPLVFLRAARSEFDDAANWYEQRRIGLGPRFTDSIKKVLSQIAFQPNFHPIVEEDVREAIVRGFPFCVYYRKEPSQILVIAVFHTSRDPSIWRERI